MSLRSRFHQSDKTAAGSAALRNLMIVLGILTLAVMAALVRNYYNARKTVSAGEFTQITAAAESQLQSFFTPVRRHLLIAENWGRNGLLNLENTEELNARFVPVLDQVPQIHSVLIAGGDTLTYSLEREGDLWKVRIRALKAAKETPARWKRFGKDGTPGEEWTDEERVNPLGLGWYVGATAGLEKAVYWTESPLLFDGADTGVTAAVGWQADGDNYAVAFNMLMGDIARLVANIRLSDAFKCFVYSGNRVRVDLTQIETAAMESVQMAKSLGVNVPEDPVLEAALDSRAGAQRTGESFAFKLNGLTWWARLGDFQGGHTRDGLGIVVPERDLVAKAHIERYLVVLAALGSVWIGLWLYARVRRREPKAEAGNI